MVLKLEGRLVGPWVPELMTAVLRAQAFSLPIEIDVWDLTYADLEGEKAIARLHQKGARFKGKSPYSEYLFQRLQIRLFSRTPGFDDSDDRPPVVPPTIEPGR